MFNLNKKSNLYKLLIKGQQDRHGFIYTDECDSLLFSGLLGCVPNVTVNIDAAFDKDSQMWRRRPIDLPECYPNHSKSTISRDMLLGLAYYAYFNKRLDISEQVINYALTHWGVMGKGDITRINIMPALLATFAWISYRLGGPSRPWLRLIPTFVSKNTEDYQAHLAVLHAYLRDELVGKSSKTHQNLYKYHADRNPKNALFQIAAGRVDKAYTILSDEQLFPTNRLPNKLDRHGPWLWERDLGHNYEPGKEDRILSGGDYLFAYWLLNRNPS